MHNINIEESYPRMPIYEYECTHCGQPLEAFQKAGEDPLRTCPHCNGVLRKRISLSSFVLKGTGWYKTDYANAPSSSPQPTSQPEQKPTAQNGGQNEGKEKADPKPVVQEHKKTTNGSS